MAASPSPQISGAPTSSPSPTPLPATATEAVTPTTPPVTTLLFTGVIVPARCIQATLDENGNPDYLYEEVRHLIAGADLAVGVLNATMSDRVAQTGCARTFQLVGRASNAPAAATGRLRPDERGDQPHQRLRQDEKLVRLRPAGHIG